MTVTITRRRMLLGSLALPFAARATRPASAAVWPNRTIKLVVGGAPGSVPDGLARLAANALSGVLGQPVIIENRPGAGGIIAMQSLLASASDGYTIGFATISQAVFNSYLYSKLSYDPQRDLQAISTLTATSFALTATPAVQANSVRELVAQSNAEPGKLMIGGPVGSPPHVAALLLMRETGLNITFVPFRTGPDALQAALRGDIQLLMDGPTLLAPQVAAGKLKALAVSGTHREGALAGVPTIAEAGFEQATCESWSGLVAPRAVPAEVIRIISEASRAILNDSEYREKVERISARPTASTPDQFTALIEREHTRWSPILRSSGLKLD